MQEHIEKKFPKASAVLRVRELTLETAAEDVQALLTFLRDDKKLMFTQLIDLCGVDYLGYEHAERPSHLRFAVVYHLLSMVHNQRIRVKVFLTESDLNVPTANGIFPAAGWYEREAYDMYGINFTGHPDLRRLLTDADFVGFPLRKDFPLEGHVEVYYDAKEKRVAYKPVDLPQELRHFDRVSEWKGMTGNAGLADADNTFNANEFK
ncbi:MAG: NADH-quinone oxidoreductase subunit C [Pseudomonas fluorescens]|nr:MAG: NADH-quinone oxidoreductase subunit C [Pseudomonas fluorescens]